MEGHRALTVDDTAPALAGAAPVGEFTRGWRVLVAAFVGMGVSIVSLIFYSSGIWVKPWQDEFGWSRAEIGMASMIGTAVLVISAPFAGRLIDRFGLRNVVTLSLILFALGLFFVSRMNGSLPLFYALAGFYSLVGVASSPLAFTRAVNAWFDKHRGLALGITLASTGVSGVLLPRLLTPYVAENGWRAGFMVMVVAILIAVPIVWLWTRDAPPEAERAAADTAAPLHRQGMTLSEAAKTRAFWTVAVIFLLVALAVAGLIPAFIPLLQDAGLSAAEVGTYGAVIGTSVILGRLLTGFLIDRIFAPYVTATAFALVGSGLLALALGGIDYALFGAIALGFGIGCEVDLIGYFSARYFGLKHYGTIYGVLYSVFQAGCGAAPVIVGRMWDVSGSYTTALEGASALLAIAVVLSLTLPRFPARPNLSQIPESL